MRFKTILFTLLIILSSVSWANQIEPTEQLAVQILDDTPFQTKFIQSYVSKAEEVDLATLQCPIPMECRVKNYTRIQCVFSSIEMLGRWAEEPKLMNPPLTSRKDCKAESGPTDAGNKLRRLGVKFEQSYGSANRQASIALIKKAMFEGRGCLIGVPHHAMVLVHYDEQQDRVCWVDNSDNSLKVQTTNIAGFNRMWRGWVLVIYADEDVIPYKFKPFAKIPVLDIFEQTLMIRDKEYFPVP